MSVTVLPQLVEAEALLSAQEKALIQQLTEIQAQRKGLQTVIAMFEGSVETNGQSVVIATPVVDKSVAIAEATTVETTTVKDSVPAKLAKGRKAKSSVNKPKATKTPKATTVRQSSPAKKTDGRTAPWQRYVFEDYRDQRLQDVVANVLKAKPKDSFKIIDVMSVIFEEGMPKAQFLKARNRISNILSVGARDLDWYRGRGGTYSMSEKAVKAS